MITASSAALAEACGYSFRDDVPKPPSGPVTEEQARGNGFGALCESFINGTPLAPMPPLEGKERARLDAMWTHAHAWLQHHGNEGWRAEVAFVYDPVADVAREVPRTTHRDYSCASATETCAATLDVVSVEEGVLVVRDWKTTSDGAPKPDATAQLEWCALFACRARGLDEVRIETLVVTEDGVSVEGVRHLDMFDLIAVRERILAIQAKVATSEPEPGEHCGTRYCRLYTTCERAGRGAPAALVQVIPSDALVRRWEYSTAIESPDHLQWLLEVNAIVKKRQEAIAGAIVAYVGEREIACEDGTIIKAGWRTMPRQNKEELLALVRRLGGTQADIDATYHPKLEPNGVRAKAPPKAKGAKGTPRTTPADGGFLPPAPPRTETAFSAPSDVDATVAALPAWLTSATDPRATPAQKQAADEVARARAQAAQKMGEA